MKKGQQPLFLTQNLLKSNAGFIGDLAQDHHT